MAKIPFDIKYRPQIESGEYKVETRDGRPARVICWDFNDGDYVIVAVVPNICGTRGFITYTDEGIYMIGEENVFDLFLITTEPELKENEDDERTRKEIIEHFLPHKNELLVKKWIAYLEKQKEQKPAEWGEEDKERLEAIIAYLTFENENRGFIGQGRFTAGDLIHWLKSLHERFVIQPKKEWSEGTKKALDEISEYLKYKGREDDADFIRNLRPQPHWKPSEEQITALGCVRYVDKNCAAELESLYDDLKKLM